MWSCLTDGPAYEIRATNDILPGAPAGRQLGRKRLQNSRDLGQRNLSSLERSAPMGDRSAGLPTGAEVSSESESSRSGPAETEPVITDLLITDSLLTDLLHE